MNLYIDLYMEHQNAYSSHFFGTTSKDVEQIVKFNKEKVKWVQFIMELIKNEYRVYAKGGSILGLQLIQMCINKIDLNELLQLKLVKDWDFAMCVEKSHHNIIIEIAKKYDIIKEGETIIVLRMKDNIKIGSDALFEISLKESDPLSELELPMTTMKIEITKDNIEKVFGLSEFFFLVNNVNMLTISRYSQLLFHPLLEGVTENVKYEHFQFHMDNLTIIIPDNENGYFKVNGNFDQGDLSIHLLELINKVTSNINEKQFLIAQIKQPDRMFYRLLGKNLKKSIMINNFLKKHSISIPTWLINIDHVNGLINNFVNEINKFATIIFAKYENEVNEKHNQIIFVDDYIKIIDKIINYCDIEKHYDEAEFNQIKKLYLDKITLDTKISKGYIKKIRSISSKFVEEYIEIVILIFNDLDLIMKGVNIGRLVGLYHTFSGEAKELIKLIMPTMNINITYFNKIIQRKKVQNTLQKNGFYQIFYKLL